MRSVIQGCHIVFCHKRQYASYWPKAQVPNNVGMTTGNLGLTDHRKLGQFVIDTRLYINEKHVVNNVTESAFFNLVTHHIQSVWANAQNTDLHMVLNYLLAAYALATHSRLAEPPEAFDRNEWILRECSSLSRRFSLWKERDAAHYADNLKIFSVTDSQPYIKTASLFQDELLAD